MWRAHPSSGHSHQPPPTHHSPHQPGTVLGLQTVPPMLGSRWGCGRGVRRRAVGKASKPGAARVWPQNHTPTPGLGDIKLSLSSLPNHLQQQKYLSEAIAGVRQKANQSRALLGQLRSGVGGLRQQRGEILSGQILSTCLSHRTPQSRQHPSGDRHRSDTSAATSASPRAPRPQTMAHVCPRTAPHRTHRCHRASPPSAPFANPGGCALPLGDFLQSPSGPRSVSIINSHRSPAALTPSAPRRSCRIPPWALATVSQSPLARRHGAAHPSNLSQRKGAPEGLCTLGDLWLSLQH